MRFGARLAGLSHEKNIDLVPTNSQLGSVDRLQYAFQRSLFSFSFDTDIPLQKESGVYDLWCDLVRLNRFQNGFSVSTFRNTGTGTNSRYSDQIQTYPGWGML